MNHREENIQRFEELMNTVTREGTNELMKYIREKTDFYTAPASTRFHLACEGGLLQHSLNVYDCLIAKKESPIWKKTFEAITDESLVIMALLHDFCKANCYVKSTKNQKTYDPQKVAAANQYQVKHDDKGDFVWETVPCYETNEELPLGHGEKSAILISYFIKLKREELFAIRWHMGFSVDKDNYKALGEAMEKYPVVLALFEADLEATKLLEDDFGNKKL